MLNRVLPLTLVLLAAALPAQPNLINNGGFESAPTAAHVPGGGWWLYEARGHAEIALDTAVAHDGHTSVRLGATEGARYVLASAPFAVSPGDELHFAAWIRTDDSAGNENHGNFALVFRDAAGAIVQRANVPVPKTAGEWKWVAGDAVAGPTITRAEIHLGYNGARAVTWFDDVSASIKNPISVALVRGAQPWIGRHELSVRIINRAATDFRGTLDATAARRTETVPVSIAAGAEQTVSVPVTLPSVGNFDYHLTLKDGTATVRTVAGKFKTSGPLALFPACPCYLPVASGTTETRVDARILVDPSTRAGLRLVVSLIDSDGKTVGSGEADASRGDIVGVSLPVPSAAVARYTATAKLQDRTGQDIAHAETDVHVIQSEGSKVTLGSDGFLRTGGKPSFPIGMYSTGRAEDLAHGGFTAIHSYQIVSGDATEPINPSDTNLKNDLDRAAAAGLRMMVEVPRKAVEKAQWAQVRRRIETFRNHPGLLCWGSEERVARGEAPLANLEQLYRLVHELDPNHPLVLGDTRDVIGKLQKDRRDFFPDQAMDVGIWWWYPIPLTSADGNGLDGREKGSAQIMDPPSWLTTTRSKKPLWIAIQSYQKPQRDARFPTPDEYRCQAYLSIINGVKGLWFYLASGGQRDWQGKAAGLLNKPEEGHWDYVQKLVHELRDLEPVIVSPAVSGQITTSPASAPVEFTVREKDGALYLLAANKAATPQTVRFEGPRLAGKKLTLLFEDNTASELDGPTAKFRPFGTHVFRIE